MSVDARILAQYHPHDCTCVPCTHGRVHGGPGKDSSRPTGTPPPYDWARGKGGRGKDGVCRHEFIPSPFSSLGICRHCAWQRWAK